MSVPLTFCLWCGGSQRATAPEMGMTTFELFFHRSYHFFENTHRNSLIECQRNNLDSPSLSSCQSQGFLTWTISCKPRAGRSFLHGHDLDHKCANWTFRHLQSQDVNPVWWVQKDEIEKIIFYLFIEKKKRNETRTSGWGATEESDTRSIMNLFLTVFQVPPAPVGVVEYTFSTFEQSISLHTVFVAGVL